jgi:flavin-dependent dehydrogenase
MFVRSSRTALPIIEECKLVVIGGSMAGVAAAVALARNGQRVVLVEPRTYLGREISATQRPWLARSQVGHAPPSVIAKCIAQEGVALRQDEYALHLDALKTCLENLALEAGVDLLYSCYPVGIVREDGSLRGIVIANKSGRQAIECQAVLDATETALAARLAGSQFVSEGQPAVYRRTVEFDRVDGFPGNTLPVPADLGLAQDSVAVHRGCLSTCHVYVDYGVHFPSRVSSLCARRALDALMQRKGLELVLFLRACVPKFGRYTQLGASSYEPWGPMTDQLSGPSPEWAREHEGAAVPVVIGDRAVGEAELSSFAAPQPGLWCLSEAARIDPAMAGVWADVVAASRLGDALGALLSRLPRTRHRARTGYLAMSTTGDVLEDLEIAEQEVPQRGRSYRSMAVEPLLVPVVEQGDVLTVGGGSSGAVAAITAGQEGLRSILVDMNPGLGGTGTYGGINTYWFARRIGFVDRLMGWLDDMHERLSLPGPEGVMATWNVEARICALRQKAEEAGVSTLLNALAFGSITRGKEVCGAVAATAYGPVAMLAQVTLDATGDGDVAAWAGAQAVYGSSREHAVMWAYMPQVAGPGRPRNVKTSMVDTTNVRDYVRMILAERRRRQEGDYDHGIYLAPRESRHVLGGVVMTLTDQLLKRCWPDVVFVAFSNYDMKGESTSDWVRMGIQPPNLEIEIPYRALIPNGIENILVVGKAFSATHDALAAPRMQPDLENLGGVAALAAAMALQAGVAVRALDVRQLQERLVGVRALPESALRRRLEPMDYTDQELAEMIAGLDADRPLHDYSNQKIGERYEGRIPEVDTMCSGARVIPMLEAAMEEAQGPRKVLLARMLGILGSRQGVPVLIGAVGDLLAPGVLPGRTHRVQHVGLPPDQGCDPEAVHLLYALGLACDPRALALWHRVVDMLQTATKQELFDGYQDLYAYAAAVCYGAERLGDPRAAPILEKLHSHPLFRNQVAAKGVQPDFLEERQACVELMIGRALARCGSPQGYVVLISYLGDARASLAEHAHEELIALTGQDYGKDMAAWSNWLEMAEDGLGPKPFEATVEPIAAWSESYLIQR